MEKIFRYKNRKLYNPAIRGFVTYDTLLDWENTGRSFMVIDHGTKNDITVIVKARAALHKATKDFYGRAR